MTGFWYYFLALGDVIVQSRYGRIGGDLAPNIYCGSGRNVLGVYTTPNVFNPVLQQQ